MGAWKSHESETVTVGAEYLDENTVEMIFGSDGKPERVPGESATKWTDLEEKLTALASKVKLTRKKRARWAESV